MTLAQVPPTLCARRPLPQTMVCLILLAVLATGIIRPTVARGATSRFVVPFQGAVAVKPGQPPIDANAYGARFQIYTAASGGTLLFQDIQNIRIRQGVFSVELGGGSTPLNPAIARNNSDLWLQIAIDLNRDGFFSGAETFLPRIHLGSSPVALFSSFSGRADSAAKADVATTADRVTNLTTVPNATNAVTADRAKTLILPSVLKNSSGATVAQITSSGVYLPSTNLGTTAVPQRGGVYRDNQAIAWGTISASGALLVGFGIRSVTLNIDNTYDIVLDNDVVIANSTAAYAVCLTAIDAIGNPRVLTYNPLATNRIRVAISAIEQLSAPFGFVSFPHVLAPFSIIVFGRLR